MEKVVILGAGLAGLSCAYHLKDGYEIYEKEAEVGGLCRSRNIDGFTFDYDAHLLHFENSYTLDLLKTLMDGNLTTHDRDSWIFSKKQIIETFLTVLKLGLRISLFTFLY